MAGTYVQITREEMETFLQRMAQKFGTRMQRDTNYEGIYRVPFSQNVALKISTSVGSKNEVVGRGKGAIHLSLVSLVNGKPLATKKMTDYIGQTRVNRTSGWERSLDKAIQKAHAAYLEKKNFFEQIALGEEAKEVVDKDLLSRIENFPNWKSNTFLKSLHDQISRGKILSEKQQTALDRALSTQPKNPSSNQNERNEEDYQMLRDLYVWVRNQKFPNWERNLEFIQSVGEQVSKGRDLSPKQREVINNIKRRTRASKVAAIWLSR